MSEVRTCERCNYQSYASEQGAARQRTIEFVTDDGEILGDESHLCAGCVDKIQTVDACPFCLEADASDDHVRACKAEQDEPEPEVGKIETFTGTVVQTSDPIVLDDGQETATVDADPVDRPALGEKVAAAGPITEEGHISVGRNGVLNNLSEEPSLEEGDQ